MPNGGVFHCYSCCNFQVENGYCVLRKLAIDRPHWTTCPNWNKSEGAIDGPLFAMVGEVKSGALAYSDIPYFDGCRVDTTQIDSGDTSFASQTPPVKLTSLRRLLSTWNSIETREKTPSRDNRFGFFASEALLTQPTRDLQI